MSLFNNSFPVIEINSQLSLREINFADSLRLFELYKDHDVESFLPDNFRVSQLIDIYNEVSYLRNVFYDKIGIYWAISNDSNLLIGTCGINKIDSINKKCTIGFDLLKEYRKKGIMYNSLSKIIEYIFNDLKLHRIEAYTETTNTNCHFLLEKLHFAREGLLRDFEIRSGQYKNFYCYALCNNY